MRVLSQIFAITISKICDKNFGIVIQEGLYSELRTGDAKLSLVRKSQLHLCISNEPTSAEIACPLQEKYL